MAAAFVQACQNGGDAAAGTIVTANFGSAVTAGNAILVALSWDDTTPQTPTMFDSKSNAGYSAPVAKYVDVNAQAIGIWYALNVATGGSTFNVSGNFSPGAAFRRIVAFEVSGLATSSALDKNAQNETTGGTFSSSSVTTTTNGQFIFAASMNDGTAAHTYSQGTGFTEPANATASAANNEMQAEYQVQASAGAITANWVRSSSGLNLWALATFKTPAAPGKARPVFHRPVRFR